MEWQNTELIKPTSIGFIYMIKHVSGKYYIGKKNLKAKKNKKIVDSNWKNYWGSNKQFLSYIKEEGKEKFSRTILIVCDSQYQLTYWEIDTIIKHNWIDDQNCFNSNLLGKFYRNKLRLKP